MSEANVKIRSICITYQEILQITWIFSVQEDFLILCLKYFLNLFMFSVSSWDGIKLPSSASACGNVTAYTVLLFCPTTLSLFLPTHQGRLDQSTKFALSLDCSCREHCSLLHHHLKQAFSVTSSKVDPSSATLSSFLTSLASCILFITPLVLTAV